MNNREKWWESVRDITASATTWWWDDDDDDDDDEMFGPTWNGHEKV